MLAATRDRCVVAFDLQGVVEQPRADLKTGFDQADIFIAGPKQGFNATADLYAGFHSEEMRECNSKPDIRGRGGRINIYLHHSRKKRVKSHQNAGSEGAFPFHLQ